MALTLQQARQEAIDRRMNALRNVNNAPEIPQGNAQQAEDLNFFEKAGATLLDVGGNILSGALRSLEGIMDFGAGIVGGIGGLFDEGFAEDTKDFINRDIFVGESGLQGGLDDLSQKSYLQGDAGNFVRNVSQGVGGMLPSIAVAAVTGGTSLAAQAAFGLGAAGQGLQEATQDGATLGQGLGYGTLSGITELATERLGGYTLGGAQSVVGKRLAGTALGKATSKGIGKVAETIVSEGAEEVLGDLVNPALKYVTGVDRNIGENYKETIKGLPETFAVGGVTGAVLGGGQNIARNIHNKSRGGAYASKADNALSYINEVSQNYGKDNVKNERYGEAVQNSYRQASQELQQMQPEQRAKYLESIGVQKLAFNEDGTLRATSAENVNQEAVSPRLRGISGNLEYIPVSSSVAISENALKVKKGLEAILGERGNVVITDGMERNQRGGYNASDDIFYINNKAELSDHFTADMLIAHEITHKSEGTKAYSELVGEIEKLVSDPNMPVALKEKIGSLKDRETSTRKRYAGQTENMGTASREYVVSTELTADYIADFLGNDYFIEKLSSQNQSLAKRILSSLKRLITGDKTSMDKETARYLNRLYNKYRKAINVSGQGVRLSNFDDEEESGIKINDNLDFDFKNKAKGNLSFSINEYTEKEKLNWKDSKNIVVYESIDQLQKFVQKSMEDNQYSKKMYFGAIGEELAFQIEEQTGLNLLNYNYALRSDEVRKIFKDHGRDTTEKLRGQRPVTMPDILAIPNILSDATSITLSEKEYNGQPAIKFSKISHNEKTTVVAVVSRKHLDLRVQTEYIGIKKGTLATPLGEQAPNNTPEAGRGTDSINSISQNAENVNTKRKKGENKRYSLSENDSEGGNLTEQQRQFFNGSKVTDDSGRLLTTYHGSPNEFFTFDRERIGKGNDQFGAGFYFATSEDASRNYGNNVHKTYLNIQKPIVINRTEYGGDLFDVSITQKQAYEILKRHPLMYDPESSPLGDLFAEYWEVGVKDYMIREAAKNYNSIGLLDSDYTAFRDYPNELHEAIRDVLGYDGIEVRFDNTPDRFYVAWFENQIKLTSNKKPTAENPDIRYALLETDNTGASLSQEQRDFFKDSKHKAYIDNKLKTFTQKDASSVIDDITEYFAEINANITIDGKGDLKKRIYALLNETAPQDRLAAAEAIARKLVYQDLVENVLLNDEEIDGARKNGIEIDEVWVKKKLSGLMANDQLEAAVGKVKGSILDTFVQGGKLTEAGKVFERYGDFDNTLKWYKNEVAANRMKNNILDISQKLKAKNYPKSFEGFDQFRSMLSKIKYRSDINKASTRKLVSEFGKFYRTDNEVLEGYFSAEVRGAIESLETYNGKGALDVFELEQVETVLKGADFLLREYDKARLDGKKIEVSKEASRAVETVKDSAPIYRRMLLGKSNFLRSIVDARTLALWLDGGAEGVITKAFNDLAYASTKQVTTVMELNEGFERFLKVHKKFYDSLEKALSFTFNGKQATASRAEAIALYLTSLQEDGLYHLAYGGFAVKGKNGIERYQGVAQNSDEQSAMSQLESEMSRLYESFTQTEKEYIALARQLFNKKAKKIKQDVDMERMGVTNARVKDYYPLRVYEGGKLPQQAKGFIEDLNLVANQSIHKDRVKGSKQTLLISPVNLTVMNHIRQISMYNAYAIPLDTMRRIMHKNINTDAKGKTVTANAQTLISAIRENAWSGFDKYLEKFMLDVQGGSVKTDTIDTAFRWLRSNYAKFQLGLNIKTMASQLTSLPMASQYVGWGNLLKGAIAKPNVKEMLEYSDWARARNYEGAAYKAQSLTDHIDTLGQLAMKPIGMVDLFTMNRIYNACKYYIAGRDGLALDSKEVKTESAKMLEKIGRETQNNSEAAEKSALMRSPNEIMKSLVMFTSDSMKQFSSLVQAMNKVSFLRQRIKLGKGDIQALQNELKAANREVRHAIASVIASSTFYVLMGMLINYGLFAREPDDDENMIEVFLKNFGGSVTGMIPIVKDLYSIFAEGYELNNFAYDTFNNFSQSIKNIGGMFTRLAGGERVTEQDLMKGLRELAYSIGQLTGMPVRNVYNALYGLVKRFSPSAAYDINALFYGAKTEDLTKAIEKGDDKLADAITQQLLSAKGIEASKTLAEEFKKLFGVGFSLPRGVSDSVSYDGEEYPLGAKEQGVFIDNYREAALKAEGLIQGKEWSSVTDDVKAGALDFLFNYYYYKALYETTEAAGVNKYRLLGTAIDVEKIALAVGELKTLTAEIDQKGNVINGTKKAKVEQYIRTLRLSAAQKYILLGYAGYKNANGKSLVTAYVNGLGLSKDQKQALLSMSGY